MDTLLVTGGAGFIGSHFCQLISRTGCNIIVYDNLERGNRQAARWGQLIQGDLRDTSLLRRIIREYRVTQVVHFAALAYVRESMLEPDNYWSNNVEGTRSLLEAMRDSSVRHLVFSSSCATYGLPPTLPIGLNSPQQPINPYGRTKLVCEWMIRDLAERHDRSYALLRYFNVAGSDPGLEIGETHQPETHIIPAILLKALETGSEPVRIHGRDYPTPDGTCVRDFIHVVDLARIHLGALSYLARGGPSRSFNAGLGRGVSIGELITMCQKITGREIPVAYEEPHPGDPPVLIADPGDTWRQLQLEPIHTDIAEMIRHSWDWIRLKRHEWLLS